MSQPTHPNDQASDSAWRRFWNRGGWWRAALIVFVYLVVYQLLGLALSPLVSGLVDAENPLGDPLSIFFGVALPILLMGLLTLGFVASVGWQKEIFGRQPVEGRGWMWLAVVIIIIPIVIRLFAINWSAYGVTVILSALFLGLCVGLAEELITRGVAVNLLRRGGHSERVVMVLSSLLFALLHSANILSGQSPILVIFTVVYAFGFGAMMYLSMRLTGRIVWAMLLHAATDPTTFLATGGIDAHGATAGDNSLLLFASIFNYLYLLVAIVVIFVVKGRVYGGRSSRRGAVQTAG